MDLGQLIGLAAQLLLVAAVLRGHAAFLAGFTQQAQHDGQTFAHGTEGRAISDVLKKVLVTADYVRISDSGQSSEDMLWVDKVPSSDVYSISDELKCVIDSNIGESEDLKFKWRSIRDHLCACQIYISVREILIRPLIPPTWTHSPFADAKQRIYMSATLGQAGDLERMTGRAAIKRLSVPEGWERRGIGRRYFIFPERSLEQDQVIDLRNRLMEVAGRSLVFDGK